jgi:hypothetical protein
MDDVAVVSHVVVANSTISLAILKLLTAFEMRKYWKQGFAADCHGKDYFGLNGKTR